MSERGVVTKKTIHELKTEKIFLECKLKHINQLIRDKKKQLEKYGIEEELPPRQKFAAQYELI